MDVVIQIQHLESKVSTLEMQLSNLVERLSNFTNPVVRSLPERITPAQIAKTHGTQTQNVTKYRGVFASLKEFEKRNVKDRIYFDRKDYEKWLREQGKTPEEKAAELDEKTKSRRKRSVIKNR